LILNYSKTSNPVTSCHLGLSQEFQLQQLQLFNPPDSPIHRVSPVLQQRAAVEPKVTKRNSKIKAQISDLMEEIADLKLQLASSNARNEILLELMDKYMKVHE
jgi:hypothetical protein